MLAEDGRTEFAILAHRKGTIKMALSLKEIQARLLEQQAKKDRVKSGGFTGDNAVYPFWNNPDGSSTTIRFLPDGDETNDFFWVERLIIRLPFAGVKGHIDSKPVDVQVPCTDMWTPNSCKITAEIRPWWKDKSLEDMARKYYRKKSYLFQGFVTSNPNSEDQAPENPIRRFIINTSVFDSVKGILLDPDLEHTPTDYEHGRDFYLIKTTKGSYANYTSSKWAMKERPLTAEELEAINKFGLWQLKSFLPKQPDAAHLTAIEEMFEASVGGEMYDPERWGQFYKPNGLKIDTPTTDSDSDARATESVAPVTPVAPTTSSVTASSILSKLGNKQPTPEVTTVEESTSTTSEKSKPQTPEEIIAAIRRRQQQK